MKTIAVQPTPGGWTVQSEFTGAPLLFLEAEHAERNAYRLAQMASAAGRTAQVLVKDERGVTVSSAVVGPGSGARLGLVHRSGLLSS